MPKLAEVQTSDVIVEIHEWLRNKVTHPFYISQEDFQEVYDEFDGKFVVLPEVQAKVSKQFVTVRNVSATLYVSEIGYIEIFPQYDIGYNPLQRYTSFIELLVSKYTTHKECLAIGKDCNIDSKVQLWIKSYHKQNKLPYDLSQVDAVYNMYHGRTAKLPDGSKGIIYVSPKGFLFIGKVIRD